MASDLDRHDFSSLAQKLAELKHTISTPHLPKNAARRAKPMPVVEATQDARDKMFIVLVDPKGKRARVQVPVTSMARLQDFFEDKYVMCMSLL
jgi:hypothetical protein